MKKIKKHPALILSITSICLIFVSLCGLGVYWTMQNNHYPAATRVTGVDRCGTAETYRYSRAIRISTHQCFTTTDSWGEVSAWYRSNGYNWHNDGQMQIDSYSFAIHYFRTERVYILEFEEGQRDIRIYTDYTIRLP